MSEEVKKRDTIGKISSDLIIKTPDSTDPIEIERELHTDYEKGVAECIAGGLRDFAGDFYVVVVTKKEPLMKNVLRNYFLTRLSCPTPDYDQTVYSYNRSSSSIVFMWVVPSKDSCQLLRDNAATVAKEEWGLLDFVLKFYDGTLFNIAKKLNNELADSNILAQ